MQDKTVIYNLILILYKKVYLSKIVGYQLYHNFTNKKMHR